MHHTTLASLFATLAPLALRDRAQSFTRVNSLSPQSGRLALTAFSQVKQDDKPRFGVVSSDAKAAAYVKTADCRRAVSLGITFV